MLKLLALAALFAAAAAYPNIEDFHQSDATLSTVTLTWTLDVTEFTPIIYTLVVDNLLTIQFFHDGSFTYTVTGLSSCQRYSFVLTVSYDDGSSNPASASGSTLYEVPGSVEDLAIEGSIITWTPPSNWRCVEYYNVCYESAVTDISGCVLSVDASYDLGQVSGCDDVTISVSGVGGTLEGPASQVRLQTDDATAGMPRDYEVIVLSETSVELAWNAPAENPACVKDYSVRYGPVDNFTASILQVVTPKEESDDDEEEDLDDKITLGPSGQENIAILNNLEPCTEYLFAISSLSKNDERSPEVVENKATNGTAPGEVPDITYDKDEDSITITWGDVSVETCLNRIQICYSDPVEIHTECFEVPKSPNAWTLAGLKACREYDFMIRGQTADGQSGPPTYISVSTKDVAPGPVREMHLGSIGVTSLTVTYMDPLLYPECVQQFVITYRNLLDVTKKTKKADLRGSNYTDQINGLDACGLYEVGVFAVSPSGLEGNVTYRITALKETIPEPPITGTMVAATKNSATLLWYAPLDTRFCVDSYTVRVVQPGGGPGVTEIVNVTTNNEEVLHTFNGLGPCTGYVAEMSATNAEKGTSDYDQVVSDIWTTC